jgi:hypothetical protein
MDEWEVVRTLGTEEEAALIAGYLESQGVRVEIESLWFHLEPVNFGRLGEVRVKVPAAEAERARALLDDLPETSGADSGEDSE